MSDYWVYGLIALGGAASLYGTITQMVQRSGVAFFPYPKADNAGAVETAETNTDSTNSQVILGSDQPVDEDPDFDIDMDDLGAIASFENKRF